jgi:hypothetical protein
MFAGLTKFAFIVMAWTTAVLLNGCSLPASTPDGEAAFNNAKPVILNMEYAKAHYNSAFSVPQNEFQTEQDGELYKLPAKSEDNIRTVRPPSPIYDTTNGNGASDERREVIFSPK